MKKKFLVGSLLPVLAGAAVVGSGFSLWFFNDTVKPAEQDVSKNVTQLVAVGEITTADKFSIVFDQSDAGRTANAGANVSTSSKAQGIHVSFDDGANTVVKYTSPTDGIDELKNTNGEYEVYFKFTVQLVVSNSLANYIDGATYNKTVNETVKANVTAGDSNTTYEFVLDKCVREFDWSKVTFTYKNEPKDATEYEALKNIVVSEDTTITAKYKVEVLGESK